MQLLPIDSCRGIQVAYDGPATVTPAEQPAKDRALAPVTLSRRLGGGKILTQHSSEIQNLALAASSAANAGD
jgi:hypothetical protein